MPDSSDEALSVEIINDLDRVDAGEWDACAGAENPFLSHAFLSALEDSGCATAEQGWMPYHLAVRGADGKLDACAPLYVKGHSYGEYIFDWGWADAAQRAGLNYYPKLQCAVPFTPATGPRLLIRDGADRPQMQRLLIAGMIQVAQELKLSSLHITFPTQDEWEQFGKFGLLQRVGQQFHWENRGYQCFDDFLADLSSRKRKSIRRERRDAERHDLTIRTLTGDDLKPHHWDAFYKFYLATIDKKWSQDYLNRDFFHILGERLPDRAALIYAEMDGTPVAGALNLIGSDTLFGRNWGCLGDFRFLHFECCYYRAIDFAIEHGLKWVEAGAQGHHKIQRGYLPRKTYSAHWIADPRLESAIADFVQREAYQVEHEMTQLEAEYSPFRQEN
tara:strand:+ start:76375 stop:77541 length:1167 start_codon:yes stop_codon:yes gene_type:complete